MMEDQNTRNEGFTAQFKDSLKQITQGREVSKQLNTMLKNTKEEAESMEGDFLRFKEDF